MGHYKIFGIEGRIGSSRVETTMLEVKCGTRQPVSMLTATLSNVS